VACGEHSSPCTPSVRVDGVNLGNESVGVRRYRLPLCLSGVVGLPQRGPMGWHGGDRGQQNAGARELLPWSRNPCMDQ
jgi:hypothetical protein